jgi:hypothetical protein
MGRKEWAIGKDEVTGDRFGEKKISYSFTSYFFFLAMHLIISDSFLIHQAEQLFKHK